MSPADVALIVNGDGKVNIHPGIGCAAPPFSE
jgi:hypothetical protein